MFENLKAELTRKNIKYKDLAEKADINMVTLRQKINGKSEFNLSEKNSKMKIIFPIFTNLLLCPIQKREQ